MSVQVVKNKKTGAVVVPFAQSPDYGFIGVETVTMAFKGGWMNKERRYASIKGLVRELEALNFTDGQKLEGQILIKESFMQSYPDQQPKINPAHDSVEVGDDGKVKYSNEALVLSGGNRVYRNTIYTENMNDTDFILVSDTVNKTIESSKEQNVLAVNS